MVQLNINKEKKERIKCHYLKSIGFIKNYDDMKWYFHHQVITKALNLSTLPWVPQIPFMYLQLAANQRYAMEVYTNIYNSHYVARDNWDV